MEDRQKKRAGNKKKMGGTASTAGKDAKVRWTDLDKTEQMSIVCDLFCRGLKIAEIATHISKTYGVRFTRESTYPILALAVRRGWIVFNPPRELALQEELRNCYDWIEDAKVVHTSRFEDVARHGAGMLIDLLKKHKRKGNNEVHIGFAGGHAMRKLAQVLAKLVIHADGMLPNKLTLHAIVAGFNIYEPTTDPNTFFTLFHTPAITDLEIGFVGLHAPAVVRSSQYATLRKMDGIKESYKEARKIDIFVTSATNWSDDHSTFRKYMDKSKDCPKLLESANCVGDMLWRPVGANRPIEKKTEIRAMTLMELNELSSFIKKGSNVVLVLGPCSQCNKPKGEILKAVLEQKDNLITHLVADSRSVREALA